MAAVAAVALAAGPPRPTRTGRVASALSDAHVGAIKDALKGVTGGKDVEVSVKVEPAIIGGLIVKLGSRMVDGSLRTKLNSIRTRMKEVG